MTRKIFLSLFASLLFAANLALATDRLWIQHP